MIDVKVNPLLETGIDKEVYIKLKSVVLNNPFSYHYILKNDKEIMEWILSKTPKLKDSDDFKYTLGTRLNWIFNGRTNFPICNNKRCENYGKEYGIEKNLTFKSDYPKYCSYSCRTLSEEVQEKQKRTSVERYGVEYPSQSNDIQEKIKENNIRKYGVDNPSKLDYIKERQKEGYKRKYGNENYRNHVKAIETKIKKYGKGCNWGKIKEAYSKKTKEEIIKITDKIRNTKLRKYGDEKYNNHDKCIKTLENNYGVSSSFEIPGVRNKIKSTMLKKYGVDHNFKMKGFYERHQRNHRKYEFDGYCFDSKPEVAFYIFKRDNGYDIIRNTKVFFTFNVFNIEFRYYPDFIVNGKYVEIKGDHFFKNKDVNSTMIFPWNPKIGQKLTKKQLDSIMEEKHRCMILNKVDIITSVKYEKYIKYVIEHYGKDFFEKIKKHS